MISFFSTLSKQHKRHTPLIKFLGKNRWNSAPHQQSQTQQQNVFYYESITEMPAKYQKVDLEAEEIEAIMNGGLI